jgi:GNAT superfamily N-acetyltransferase
MLSFSSSEPLPHRPGRLAVTHASAADWVQVERWAADEGWNPGPHDGACFLPQDPEGFYVGRLGEQLVSAISVVNYDTSYAHLGYYLVHPDHRGHGHGLRTWHAAIGHVGARTVGLDAVLAQQATYQRSGFTPAYRTVRYAGCPETAEVASGTEGILPAAKLEADLLVIYDSQCAPAERAGFLTRWISAPGHAGFARIRDGELTGYGVIRPAQVGYRIGPLFASTSGDAETLFDALIAGISDTGEDGGRIVAIDVPEPNHTATALAARRGWRPASKPSGCTMHLLRRSTWLASTVWPPSNSDSRQVVHTRCLAANFHSAPARRPRPPAHIRRSRHGSARAGRGLPSGARRRNEVAVAVGLGDTGPKLLSHNLTDYERVHGQVPPGLGS